MTKEDADLFTIFLRHDISIALRFTFLCHLEMKKSPLDPESVGRADG
jgi:hypothetical protein